MRCEPFCASNGLRVAACLEPSGEEMPGYACSLSRQAVLKARKRCYGAENLCADSDRTNARQISWALTLKGPANIAVGCWSANGDSSARHSIAPPFVNFSTRLRSCWQPVCEGQKRYAVYHRSRALGETRGSRYLSCKHSRHSGAGFSLCCQQCHFDVGRRHQHRRLQNLLRDSKPHL